MNEHLKYWNDRHHNYAEQEWIDKPSLFATWAISYFPKSGKLLEVGAGQGQDSRYFAQSGFDVVSTDFSETALEYSKKRLNPELNNKLSTRRVDLTEPLPFEDNSFEVVYAHLSIHYFNSEITDQILDEILRVLKPDGVVAILTNSTTDPEYGNGTKLEEDYYERRPGRPQRYFSVDSLAKRVKKFTTVVLDDQGLTYKDASRGESNLIRFIGRKDVS